MAVRRQNTHHWVWTHVTCRRIRTHITWRCTRTHITGSGHTSRADAAERTSLDQDTLTRRHLAQRKPLRLTLPAGTRGPHSLLPFPPSIPPLCTHNKAFGTWEGREKASVCFAMRQRKRFLVGPARRIHTSQHGCKLVADWGSLSCFPGLLVQ